MPVPTILIPTNHNNYHDRKTNTILLVKGKIISTAKKKGKKNNIPGASQAQAIVIVASIVPGVGRGGGIVIVVKKICMAAKPSFGPVLFVAAFSLRVRR
jgi:hypothetical protein